MTIARIYTTQKSRKVCTCGKCGTEIPKGEKVLHFSVGFRGYEQHRCAKQECFPKPSERESSAVAAVYAVQEETDFSSLTSYDDITAAVEAVAEVCEEVASEYESNEMYEINYDLQERAEQIRSAGEELLSWDADIDEEPNEEDIETWGEHATFEDAHGAWVEEAQDAARGAVDGMDLP